MRTMSMQNGQQTEQIKKKTQVPHYLHADWISLWEATEIYSKQ